MKKIITLISLLIMAGSISADIVLKTKERLKCCPGMITKSGEAVVYQYSGNEITVYSLDFLVDRSFTPVKTEYQSGTVVEEAIVTPTGLSPTPENQYGGKNYSTYLEWAASSQDEMINKLREQSPYSTLIVFTDAMGNPACYDYGNSSFKYENLFGKKYPTTWYALIDGYVYRVDTYDSFYTVIYDEENAVWTRKSEKLSSHSSGPSDIEFYIGYLYYTYAQHYLSQTLFNEDDKWEYVVEEYGPLRCNFGSPVVITNNDGTMTLRREGQAHSSIVGYAVYNEDGTKLGVLPQGSFYVINGRKFLQNSDSLYEIIGDGSDFDLVEAVQAKSDRRLDAERGIVTVDIDSEQAGGEVVVSTTDGKVMASKKVGIGQTQINDQPLPTGIYVVSLLKDGRIVESEKYLVK